jgi:quercetin dioxygenase-like cupin family protein
MRPLVRTCLGLSAAALMAAATGQGLAAQADAKKQPPPPAAKKQAAEHKMSNPADIVWGPAPPGLPSGAQATVLNGDPGKAGVFTIRLKAPDGAQIMPHWHPSDEQVTVVSGALMVGMGQKWEDSALKELSQGGYVNLPRKQAHYVKMKGETVVQVTAMGPFAITYVNASDDPRTKK